MDGTVHSIPKLAEMVRNGEASQEEITHLYGEDGWLRIFTYLQHQTGLYHLPIAA